MPTSASRLRNSAVYRCTNACYKPTCSRSYRIRGSSDWMIRIPERLRCRNELDGHFGNELLEPFRAIFHARLLGNHVPEYDERFVFPGTHRVLCVFNKLPFPCLTHDQHMDIRARQKRNARKFTHVTPTCNGPVDG